MFLPKTDEKVSVGGYPETLVNIDLEQGLLGAVLTNNGAFHNVMELRAGHFFDSLHQRIFLALDDAISAGRSATPITLKGHFDDPMEDDIAKYLMKIAVSSVHVIDIKDYARSIIELSQRRALYDACKEAQARVEMGHSEDPLKTAYDLAQRFQEASVGFGAPVFMDDCEVVQAILEDLKNEVKPYPTGISALDFAMDGGLYPGKSYGFAARKKMGKTILAGTVSCNLNISGVRHLFICGEMSPKEIHQRTIARLLQVQPTIFRSRNAQNSEFLMRVADAALSSNRAIIYKNAPGLTFDELKRIVLLAKVQKKITGFILDYWQLVGGKQRGRSTAEHLDEVAQWIADISRQYGLWSIVMAQINQDGNTRGGEGLRLSFDQVYQLNAPEDDPAQRARWLEMMDTRYTQWRSVGSENRPGLFLNEKGPYFEEQRPELSL